MKRNYSNDRITVHWDSEKCIHSGNCNRQLQEVFDPSRRPWIDIEKADAETIKRVIDTCPSGALSYEEPGMDKLSEAGSIKVIEKGPYQVSGGFRLIDENGQEITAGTTCSLCRCGVSRKKPFCDGSHQRRTSKKNIEQPGNTI